MNSFYGGSPGESFTIKRIFTSKNGAENSLASDLKLGWASKIVVGDFVVVSYGMPNDENYDSYRQIDLDAEGATYNSTLWRKEYNEAAGKENGLNYKLIASMTGNTPKIKINEDVHILHPDQDPEVHADYTDVDQPVLSFDLPKAQIIEFNPETDFTVLDVDQKPQVEFDDDGEDGHKKDVATLKFKLPQSQNIEEEVPVTEVNADQVPTARLNKTNVNTPTLELTLPKNQLILNDNVSSEAIDADEDPHITFDSSGENVNNPQLKFYLPKSQVLLNENVTHEAINADQDPRIEFDSAEDKVNNPTLKFYLPKSQVFLAENVSHEVLNANEKPSLEFDSSGDKVNNPTLKFSLPQSQVFLSDNVTYTAIDADQEPYITFDSTGDNVNAPLLGFYLPKSQIIKMLEMKQLGPTELPQVTWNDADDKINTPELQFKLPRAAKFYYGDLLGKQQDYTDQTDESFAGYAVGDYYINKGTGCVYYVSAVEGNTISFTYQACLQAPKPTVSSEIISPFTEELEINTPKVNMSIDGINWDVHFSLPKSPLVEAESSFIDPDSAGSAVAAVKDVDTYKFSFQIPLGSKWYSGLVMPTEIEGAKNGDYYVDTTTGVIYRLTEGAWTAQEGTLKGPRGETLNIIASYDIEETEELVNNLQNGVDYIKEKQQREDFSPQELFAVTWKTLDGDLYSYWYYCTSLGIWGRVVLTGNFDNGLLVSNYTDDDTRVYTTKYINTLINNTDENKDKTAYSKTKVDELLQQTLEKVQIFWQDFNELQ